MWIVIVEGILSGLNRITSARLLAIRHQHNNASASHILELVEVGARWIQSAPDQVLLPRGGLPTLNIVWAWALSGLHGLTTALV